MNLEKLLVQLTAMFFLIYGLMFAVLPEWISNLVTDGAPSTASGLIDMRSTYDGLSIAVGCLMLSFARNAGTLKLGLQSVFIVLLCMAVTRMLGMIIDGNPNNLMYVYLAAELVLSIVAILLFRRMGKDI